jgi:hypothetical protein
MSALLKEWGRCFLVPIWKVLQVLSHSLNPFFSLPKPGAIIAGKGFRDHVGIMEFSYFMGGKNELSGLPAVPQAVTGPE